MRIGLITPGFSATEEDWCVPALLDLVRALAERDEVTVFALRYPHHRETYAVCGARVHATGGGARGGLARLPILGRTLARVVRQGRRRPFDVLHALWAHEPGFLAVLAGRLLKTPVLVSILGGELTDLPEIDYGGERSLTNRWLIGRALAGADRVTVGSPALARRAARRVAKEKISIRPLGFDAKRFRPAGPAESVVLGGDPALLQVASQVPVKDQLTLLAAFSLVCEKYPRARLHLVGEGESTAEIQAAAVRLGIRERVELHGPVDHGRLPVYYQQADLFVQSSRFESQGLAVLEAAACGCPVVGTGVGLVPELCPGELVAPPADPGFLARVIGAVLADSALRRRLRQRQAEAARVFELQVTVEGWREQYGSLSIARPDSVREATG